jgi:hypothetical protein
MLLSEITEHLMIAHTAAAHSSKHAASAVAAPSGKTASASKSAHAATDFSSVLASVTGSASHAKSMAGSAPKKA